MVSVPKSKVPECVLWAAVIICLLVVFQGFFRTLFSLWGKDSEYAYGMLIPFVVAYLLWTRRQSNSLSETRSWIAGLFMVLAGCIIQMIASRSGTLLLSGLALSVTLIGCAGFLWGRKYAHSASAPLAMLILMAPAPSYLANGITWRMQVLASTISSVILRFLGVPVYHDGNLLVLSSYVLEVKEACSGSRSFLAILVLALVLALRVKRKWYGRVLLLIIAPVLSVVANLIRIVGTGLVANKWGTLAANDSLHSAWGVVVFLLAVLGLLKFERLLKWSTNAYA